MFKYELGQLVYYMKDNKVHSAPILSRMLVENLNEDWDCTEQQKEFFKPFGDSDIIYHTCHGTFAEYEIYSTKEELKELI
jgi:hypothetical protein